MPTNNVLPLSADHIKSWVPEQARGRIDIIQALHIIRRQFCSRVYLHSVCPMDCERCRVEIIDLFRLEEAEKPEALLTWLAKDHAARWIEKLILESASDFPAQEGEYDRLRFRGATEPNLIEELKKQYESSSS